LYFLKENVGTCCVFAGMILVSCGSTNKNGCHDNVLIRGGYDIEKGEGENFHNKGKGQPCKLSEA